MFGPTQRSRRLGTLSVALSLVAVGLASTTNAHAACTMANTGPAAHGPLAPAVFLPASFHEDARIVGLWKFEMLAKSTPTNKNPMPDGALVDFGTQAWHSDGTELLNSGSRNPADGNFCQGVWDQIGPSTFKLNHLPLAWAAGAYLGPVKLTAVVNVDRSGQRFTGLFSQTLYQASATPGHEFDESTSVVTITGTITATRINP